jgi:periplasmic protein TonB
MMNFKNNLYRTEWLELVFAHRNKLYGAYELRQHTASTTIKALITGSLIIIAAVIAPFIYVKLGIQGKIADPSPLETEVTFLEYPNPPKTVAPPPPAIKQQKVTAPSVKFVPMTVVPVQQVIEEMPTIADLEGKLIGQETVIADPVRGAIYPPEVAPLGNGQAAANNPGIDEPVGMEVLEKYPEFPGGQAAFNKYISRSLRYPMLARENEISGRVFVSFIIEKDGSLSNIKVLRRIGGGCDEEAIRVLKGSPAWVAGVQNGRTVRVAYTMPIFFQLAN